MGKSAMKNKQPLDQGLVSSADVKKPGITRILPEPETTVFNYDPITVHGRTAYLAGQIPKQNGKLAYSGVVGETVSLDEAKQAACICAEQALAWLNESAGGLSNVERILSLKCFVSHADGFSQISEIADAASDLLRDVFGESGRHSRSVIGVKSLPRNSPVLIELTAALNEPVE